MGCELTYLLYLRTHALIVFTEKPAHRHIMIPRITQRIEKRRRTMAAEQLFRKLKTLRFRQRVQGNSSCCSVVGLFEPAILFARQQIDFTRHRQIPLNLVKQELVDSKREYVRHTSSGSMGGAPPAIVVTRFSPMFGTTAVRYAKRITPPSFPFMERVVTLIFSRHWLAGIPIENTHVNIAPHFPILHPSLWVSRTSITMRHQHNLFAI
jgi:hypothetical protein